MNQPTHNTIDNQIPYQLAVGPGPQRPERNGSGQKVMEIETDCKHLAPLQSAQSGPLTDSPLFNRNG